MRSGYGTIFIPHKCFKLSRGGRIVAWQSKGGGHEFIYYLREGQQRSNANKTLLVVPGRKMWIVEGTLTEALQARQWLLFPLLLCS